MDLLSLPDEMLANVMKFSKFETVTRLRKINVRIDKVAVRRDLNRAKVQYIGAEKGALVLEYKSHDIMEIPSEEESDNSGTLCLPSPDVYLLFEKQLKRVRGLECINIEYFEIDENWLNLLETVKKRHRTDVNFLHCNLAVSLSNLERVATKFKSVKIELIAKNTFFDEKITDHFICTVMPHAEIRFEYASSELLTSPTLALTDKTLKKVQSILPNMFSIGSNFTDFTVAEVIKTIKLAMNNPNDTVSYWLLGKVRARSKDEMIWAANELKSIEDVEVTACPFWIVASLGLMDNDMNLLRQLLSLGDQISQMKENSNLRKTRSTTSLDDNDENEDEFEEKGFSASMSAVTTLYVDDSRPQYFSRQNSVLRIPIPPRSSNRFGARNLSRRPSEALRLVPCRTLRVSADDSFSESSDSAVSPLSHTPSTVSHCSAGSRLEYSTSTLSTGSVIPSVVPTKNRSSNSSIDSGIRDSPSPTSFEERKI